MSETRTPSHAPLNLADQAETLRACPSRQLGGIVRRRRTLDGAALLQEHPDLGVTMFFLRIKTGGGRLRIHDARVSHWLSLRGQGWLGRDGSGRAVVWLAQPPVGRLLDRHAITHETPWAYEPQGSDYPPRALDFEAAGEEPWVDLTWIEMTPDSSLPWARLEREAMFTHPDVAPGVWDSAGYLDSVWRCWIDGVIVAPWPRDQTTPRRMPCARTAQLLAQQAALLIRASEAAQGRWLLEIVAAVLADTPPERMRSPFLGLPALRMVAQRLDGDDWRDAAKTWRTFLARQAPQAEDWPALVGHALALTGEEDETASRMGDVLEAALKNSDDSKRLHSRWAWHRRAGDSPQPAGMGQTLARLALGCMNGLGGAPAVPCVWPDGLLEWDGACRREPGGQAAVAHASLLAPLALLSRDGLRDVVQRGAGWTEQSVSTAWLAANRDPWQGELAHALCRWTPDLDVGMQERLLGRLAACDAYGDLTLWPSEAVLLTNEARALGLGVEDRHVRVFRLGKGNGTALLCMNLSPDPQAIDLGEGDRAVRMPNGTQVDTSSVIAIPPHTGVVLVDGCSY